MNGGLSAEYRLLVYGAGNRRVMFFTHSSRAYGRTESAYGNGSSYFKTPTLHTVPREILSRFSLNLCLITVLVLCVNCLYYKCYRS